MSEAKEKQKSREEEIQESHSSVLEGVITNGDLKGKAFVVYLGDTPAKSQLVINNIIMPCTRIEVVVDREQPAINVKFNCWFLPEGIDNG
jgi:aspartate/glutamate racemase